MDDLVTYRREGAIVLLTLNRPDVRNVLSGEGMPEAVAAAVERLERDLEARVAILTGAGTAFSAGGDLKRMRDGAAVDDPPEGRYRYLHGIQQIPRAFARLDVPVIAAVNGPAIGAGLDLACMCDIRIASEKARFAESFIKLGLVSGDGGAWFLPRVIGLPKAIEMSFTGDILDADEALAWRLVTKVVPTDALLDEAMALAGRIARHPAQALRMTKRLLQKSQVLQLDEMLDLAAGYQALAHTSPAHRAAVEEALEELSSNRARVTEPTSPDKQRIGD